MTIIDDIKNIIGDFKDTKNNKADMTLGEMLFYGIVPMFGQMLMRIDKLGGSLDKPYLLFLGIPPFSFIPVLMAKFGFIKKRNAGKMIDSYVLIPIIFKLILVFAMAYITNVSTLVEFMIQSVLIFGALLLTNMLHSSSISSCKKGASSFFERIPKDATDSMLQYSAGILSSFLILFVPFLGTIIEVINMIPIPNIGEIVNSIIWSFGLVAGYLVINMYDANYMSIDNLCKGKIGSTRLIVSIIAFVAALGYQLKDLIM
jgi:hypothetical protein